MCVTGHYDLIHLSVKSIKAPRHDIE